jgi:branched-chain amino acid transport system substrate-binding protein
MRPLLTTLSAALLTVATSASAQDVIKIGDVNSYKAQPAHLENYKRGMELALEEVNNSGGVNGKKVVLVTRDDNANPGEAVRVAEELVTREQVHALSGSFLSNVALALGDFAKQKKVFFLATMSLSDKMIWQSGNRYTFRLRAGTYTQTAMLVEEAVKLKKKRWALVYPNYEFGQSAAATFKTMLKAAQPDVEFVAEQAPPLGKLEPGSVVQAIADSNPDAIFNVLFSADLIKFARAGKTRGLFTTKRCQSGDR